MIRAPGGRQAGLNPAFVNGSPPCFPLLCWSHCTCGRSQRFASSACQSIRPHPIDSLAGPTTGGSRMLRAKTSAISLENELGRCDV